MVDKKKIVQIGIMVKDVRQAAKEWADYLEVEVPEIRITDKYADGSHTMYYGKPTDGRLVQAAFNLDNIQLELVQPYDDDEPSFWRECLEKDGEGIHHFAFEAQDIEAEIEKCEANNMPLAQKGDFKGGCYSFIDAREKLGIIMEYLEHFNR